MLEMSGPQAWSGAEIAAAAARLTGRAINYRALPIASALAAAAARGEPAYLQQHLREVLEGMAQGAAAGVTATVEQVCGRPARRLEAWLGDTLAPATG